MIRRLTIFLIGLLCVIFLEASPLKDSDLELQKAIDRVFVEEEPHAIVGMEVISLEDNRVIYQKNAEYRLIPASSIKVLIAGAALDVLGKEFCFETAFRGKLQRGIIKECSLVASGDPSLSFLDLEGLIGKLKALGVNEIEGDLAVDLSIFDSVSMGPGWMWDEKPAFWCSPLAAFNVDHNCSEVTISPSLKVGHPCIVSLGIDSQTIQIECSAETVNGENALKVFRTESKDDRSIFKVEGALSLKSQPKKFSLPVKIPEYYATDILKSLLKKNHITFRGEVTYLFAPQEKMPVIAKHASASLKELIQTMLKESDNLFADALFKKLGAVKYGLPGTWEKGRFAVRDFIKSVGLDWQQMEVVDGCGLSRYNLLSAHQMVYFLQWMAKSSYASQFQAALSVGGLDGTLKRRMQSPLLKANVRAKTGTMQGVTTLSGYLRTQQGKTIAFAIFINNYLKKGREVKLKIVDAILEILANDAP